jgi:hypothetical protein
MTHPDNRPINVQLIEANGRWAKYEEQNREQHATIIARLSRVDVLVGILKVLGLLVLALMGSAIGFVAAGANWISSVEEHIHRVELEEKSNAREGFQIARSLQKEVNALQVAVQECQQRHGIRPGKE